MKYLIIITVAIWSLVSCSSKEDSERIGFQTVCNPMDLSYRFRPEVDEPSRREAADPTVIKFNDEYWLFASKSGGYWYSLDMKKWNFVLSNEIPTEDYAPTAIVMNDTIYLAISSKKNKKVYKCADPHSGHWIVEDSLEFAVEDPCFYMDDDEKLYLYWGCSNVRPLYGAEIDPQTFKLKSEIAELIHQNPTDYGWEVRGDYNMEYGNAPWLEGLWMTKYNDKYYLQYSAPGTREKSYSDGLYVGLSPLGPFTLAVHNPFSYKPEGFACGAGHGSTIQDNFGNYWHLGTVTISKKHIFERRISFYPAFFDEDEIMYTNTRYGDFPTIIPDHKITAWDDIFPGWMLLSYNKNVTVSSSIEGHEGNNICDEEIRTFWSAKTGAKGEWATIDLGTAYDVYAIQANFYENETELYGRTTGLFHRYIIEASMNGDDWELVLDKSNNETDNTHDYTQLKSRKRCRFVRITNIDVPDGTFTLCGLRVFGKGDGAMPSKINALRAERNNNDRRSVTLFWDDLTDVTGYNVSFGISANKLYQNYLVYGENSVTINSLNKNQSYYFTVEAFNENGITQSGVVVEVE